MTTLVALAHMMERYNQAVAPMGKCEAWQRFVEQCLWDLHRLPWSEKAMFVVPEGFAQYWMHVAAGESRDYDPASGDYLVGVDA
jgi:hypothetical protein